MDWIFAPEDGGLFHFILLSIFIGGVLAWAAGRAIAGTWRSFWLLPVYMLVLAAAVRFLHYALFGEALLSLDYFIVAFVIVTAAAAYGFRSERAQQMATQYSWLYSRSGPLGWTART